MDNNQNNGTPVPNPPHDPTAYTPKQAESASTQPPASKMPVNPVEQIKKAFASILRKPKSKPAQAGGSAAKPKVSMPKLPIKKIKKIAIIAVLVIVLLLILMVIIKVMGSRTGNGPQVYEVTPSPTPTATPKIGRPSPYADDPDIADIQKQLDNLDKQLDAATFREDTLRVPQLDWDVNFDK